MSSMQARGDSICLCSPCSVGFAVVCLEFTPRHTNSPNPGAVWLTIAVAKALKGHGDTSSARAALARRIQNARVLNGTLLIDSVESEMTSWTCAAVVPSRRKRLSRGLGSWSCMN